MVNRPRWEMAAGTNMQKILKMAYDMQQEGKKVQVRRYEDPMKGWIYAIEPYERDCNCPGLIKFRYKEVNNEEL